MQLMSHQSPKFEKMNRLAKRNYTSILFTLRNDPFKYVLNTVALSALGVGCAFAALNYSSDHARACIDSDERFGVKIEPSQKRRELTEKLVSAWFDQIGPFRSFLHPFAEHDLCAWFNRTKQQQLGDETAFLVEIKNRHEQAKAGVDLLATLLDPEQFRCVYTERHMFGFESRQHNMPFIFDTIDAFVSFLRNSEIDAPWLTCLADLNNSHSQSYYELRLMQWRRFGEEDENDKFERASRLLPSLTLSSEPLIEHYDACSVIRYSIDRRILLKDANSTKFAWVRRSGEEPYDLYDDCIAEQMVMVVKFNKEESRIRLIAFNREGQNVEKATVMRSARDYYQQYHANMVERMIGLSKELIDQSIKAS